MEAPYSKTPEYFWGFFCLLTLLHLFLFFQCCLCFHFFESCCCQIVDIQIIKSHVYFPCRSSTYYIWGYQRVLYSLIVSKVIYEDFVWISHPLWVGSCQYNFPRKRVDHQYWGVLVFMFIKYNIMRFLVKICLYHCATPPDGIHRKDKPDSFWVFLLLLFLSAFSREH